MHKIYKIFILNDIFCQYSLRIFNEIILQRIEIIFSQQLNMGSGNGLVPSGNKPLPEPMLTEIYIAIWHH